MSAMEKMMFTFMDDSYKKLKNREDYDGLNYRVTHIYIKKID